MTQESVVISNGLNANVRSDINLAIESIATLFTGTGIPSEIQDHQLLYDSTPGTLSIRNNANNAFIIMYRDDAAGGPSWFTGGVVQLAPSTVPLTDQVNALTMIQSFDDAGLVTVNASNTIAINLLEQGNTALIATPNSRITSLPNLQPGTEYILRAGIANITLAHNPPNIIVPGGGDLILGVNDTVTLMQFDVDSWTVVSGTSAVAITSPSDVFELQTSKINLGTEFITFPDSSFDDANHKVFEIQFDNLQNGLRARFMQFITTLVSGAYETIGVQESDGSTFSSTSETSMLLVPSTPGRLVQEMAGKITMYNFGDPSRPMVIASEFCGTVLVGSDVEMECYRAVGTRSSTNNLDGINLSTESFGGLAVGTRAFVYGYKD